MASFITFCRYKKKDKLKQYTFSVLIRQNLVTNDLNNLSQLKFNEQHYPTENGNAKHSHGLIKIPAKTNNS